MSDYKFSDPFWINNPEILFKNCSIIPTQKMTNAERLNALTRLIIITTIGMYMFDCPNYGTVFIIGIILVLLLRSTQKEGFAPRRGNHDPCHTCGFDSNLSYINTKYETSPQQQFSHLNEGIRSYTHAHYKVVPVDTPAPYREVWRNEPRWCNEFSQYPQTYNIIPQVGGSKQAYSYIQDTFSQPDNKCHHDDREWIENTTTGIYDRRKHSVMPAIESAFMRDSTEYRNMILGDYVDQIGRTRNHLCSEFKPGRKTF